MGKEVKAVVMVDPLIMSVRRSSQFIFIAAEFFMRLMGVQKNKRRKPLIWIFRKLKYMDRKTKGFWRHVLFFFQKTGPQKQSSNKKLPKFAGNLRHLRKLSRKEHKNIKQNFDNAFFDYKPLPLNVPVLYIALRYSGYAWRLITKDTVFINMHRGRHIPWSESYSQYIVDKIRDFINS
jgi:hypothetical protein